MMGYTSVDPALLRKMTLGPDPRSTVGMFARGAAPQAGMNQYTPNPAAVQRRLLRMQGQGQGLNNAYRSA